jgi:hypothetical protein
MWLPWSDEEYVPNRVYGIGVRHKDYTAYNWAGIQLYQCIWSEARQGYLTMGCSHGWRYPESQSPTS